LIPTDPSSSPNQVTWHLICLGSGYEVMKWLYCGHLNPQSDLKISQKGECDSPSSLIDGDKSDFLGDDDDV
jgi:hypothetical protein